VAARRQGVHGWLPLLMSFAGYTRAAEQTQAFIKWSAREKNGEEWVHAWPRILTLLMNMWCDGGVRGEREDRR
jgi:hypothetical protein